MVKNAQELHKTRVCNSTELHNQKTCNCYATDNATVMQQDSIKTRALAVLRRNKECNTNATETKEPCNKPCNNQLKVASKVASVADQAMQQRSSDWRWFCDAHENSLPGSMCPLKRGKSADPFSECLGWQLRNRRTVH